MPIEHDAHDPLIELCVPVPHVFFEHSLRIDTQNKPVLEGELQVLVPHVQVLVFEAEPSVIEHGTACCAAVGKMIEQSTARVAKRIIYYYTAGIYINILNKL